MAAKSVTAARQSVTPKLLAICRRLTGDREYFAP
jgi:hypothetical protein